MNTRIIIGSITAAILIIMVAMIARTVVVKQPLKLGMVDLRNGVMQDAVGIETVGGVFAPIIADGKLTPLSETVVISTADDDQAEIKLQFYMGNFEKVISDTPLKRVEITGFEPAPKGVPQIDLNLLVKHDGTITLTAQEGEKQLRVKAIADDE